jgi:hypothetical protein
MNMTFEKKFEVLQVKIEIFIQKDPVIYSGTCLIRTRPDQKKSSD